MALIAFIDMGFLFTLGFVGVFFVCFSISLDLFFFFVCVFVFDCLFVCVCFLFLLQCVI